MYTLKSLPTLDPRGLSGWVRLLQTVTIPEESSQERGSAYSLQPTFRLPSTEENLNLLLPLSRLRGTAARQLLTGTLMASGAYLFTSAA